jgi:hypothetical protein
MQLKSFKKQKDFNNAMGQESLTRFDQPKKKENQTKPKQRKQTSRNKIVAKQKTGKQCPFQTKRSLR